MTFYYNESNKKELFDECEILNNANEKNEVSCSLELLIKLTDSGQQTRLVPLFTEYSALTKSNFTADVRDVKFAKYIAFFIYKEKNWIGGCDFRNVCNVIKTQYSNIDYLMLFKLLTSDFVFKSPFKSKCSYYLFRHFFEPEDDKHYKKMIANNEFDYDFYFKQALI